MTKITYIVKAGERLSTIATRYGITGQNILQQNDIPNPEALQSGDILTFDLPNPPYPWTEPVTAVEIFSPVANASYHSPMEIIGYAQAAKSGLYIRLISADGFSLGERYLTNREVDGFSTLHTHIRFIVDEPTTVILEVYEQGEEDSTTSRAKIPLTLLPGQRMLDLERPQIGELIFGEVTVSGYALTADGHMEIRLDNRDGTQFEREVVRDNGLEYATFVKILNVAVENPTPLLIGVRAFGGQDDSPIDWMRVPVGLYPAALKPS